MMPPWGWIGMEMQMDYRMSMATPLLAILKETLRNILHIAAVGHVASTRNLSLQWPSSLVLGWNDNSGTPWARPWKFGSASAIIESRWDLSLDLWSPSGATRRLLDLWLGARGWSVVWDLRNSSRTTAYLTRQGTKIKGDCIVLVRQLGDLLVTGNPDGPYPGTPHPSSLYTHMAVHRILQVQMEQMVGTPVVEGPARQEATEPVNPIQAKLCAICLDTVNPIMGPLIPRCAGAVPHILHRDCFIKATLMAWAHGAAPSAITWQCATCRGPMEAEALLLRDHIRLEPVKYAAIIRRSTEIAGDAMERLGVTAEPTRMASGGAAGA